VRMVEQSAIAGPNWQGRRHGERGEASQGARDDQMTLRRLNSTASAVPLQNPEGDRQQIIAPERGVNYRLSGGLAR
jgi:hypothetical protein